MKGNLIVWPAFDYSKKSGTVREANMKYATYIVGYAIALFGLLWVLHDINLTLALQNFHTMRWGLAILAILLDIASYGIQAWRWQLLLQPVGKLPLVRAIQAIYIGLFTNEVLPLRGGELVRVYLVARALRTKITPVFSSLVMERIFDGIWLALLIALVALFVPLPKNILEGEKWFSGVMIILALLILGILLLRPSSSRTPRKPLSWRQKGQRLTSAILHPVKEAVHALGKSHSFYWSFGVSVFMVLFQALSFYIMLRAYHLSLPFITGLATFLIIRLGTALPNAPSNIGSYQFFTVFALTFFGIDKAHATGFSIIAFVLFTLPLWALGLWALKIDKLTLATIKQEIRTVKERINNKPTYHEQK